MSSLAIAIAACRFLIDGSAVLLWGSSIYIATLVPRPLASILAKRLRRFDVVLIVIAAAATAAVLPLQAGEIGAEWGDVLNGTMMHDVLLDTSIGQAWQAQAVAALLLVVALAAPLSFFPRATALASGLLLASLALTGHAAMQEDWLGVIHSINDVMHVLSAGAWVGALVPLLTVLLLLGQPDHGAAADIALRRFSTAGHVLVALVLASGIANTLLVLGHLPLDWSSPYQAMLALKIALVVCMICLAAINRYAFVPRLAHNQPEAIRAIRRATIAEVGLGLAVIGLVAVFGMLEPF
ncbi:MAG TPA: copper homeostasis membrane protein CopD [Xanthobacteraceae bacterium]|nr:copper homeostasis membrane protein CopD [Xanthobacteraceae bacterium]